MKNAILPFRTTAKLHGHGVRQTASSSESRKTMVALLAVSIFVATAQAGLSTIASASQFSIQVFVEACRFFFAVLQIFGR
jgi:hypothetical protein